ncbi:MAG: hypothetical protein A2176_09880 [Spirochaetes bacterium RBG_13_51_14]|nr:MAG: hypothetical protein A2176_09880 [Spirochaetes bacterium RBG_13_51_14]
MILVDTSVLIDYFRNKDTVVDSLLETEELATCGIVLAELLHGVRSDNEKTEVSEAIADFNWIAIGDSLWRKVGENLNLIKKGGLTIPFQDAVIATICITNDLFLLTNDKHFEDIGKILPGLKLHK